jgi:hypothetical protein
MRDVAQAGAPLLSKAHRTTHHALGSAGGLA